MNPCKLQLADTFEIVGDQKLYSMSRCWRYLLQQGKMIYGSEFRLTKAHKAILYQLLIYAIEDQRELLHLQLNPKKGILLMGEPETGKTAMMRLTKPFFVRKKQYDIKTCRALAQEFSLKGYEMLAPLLSPTARVLLLDNLGREHSTKHYGQSCDVIPTIVEHFYEQRHDLLYPRLHITTTLSPSEIERRYGITFRKMLHELFNVIVCE